MAAGETSPSWITDLGIVWDLDSDTEQNATTSESDPNIPSHEIGPNDPILEAIFENYHEIQKVAGPYIDSIFNKEKVQKILFFKLLSNSLSIEASSNTSHGRYDFSLGYFWGGDFIIYPELLDPTGELDMSEATSLIKKTGLSKIDQSKLRFDETLSSDRADYFHLKIEMLQREMHEVFHGYLLDQILKQHSHNLEEVRRDKMTDEAKEQADLYEDKHPAPELFADKCTRADVCLYPLEPENEKEDHWQTVEDGLIVFRVRGAYKISRDGKVKIRQDELNIKIAERRPSHIFEDEYEVPDFDEFKVIKEVVDDCHLDEFVHFVHSIRELEADFKRDHNLEFNKVALGPKIKPGFKYDNLA